jgi:hypothetical protein
MAEASPPPAEMLAAVPPSIFFGFPQADRDQSLRLVLVNQPDQVHEPWLALQDGQHFRVHLDSGFLSSSRFHVAFRHARKHGLLLNFVGG